MCTNDNIPQSKYWSRLEFWKEYKPSHQGHCHLYLCLSNLMGILHPWTPASSNENGGDRLCLQVVQAASSSPDGSVPVSAKSLLDLTLNSHFQPDGLCSSQGNQGYPCVCTMLAMGHFLFCVWNVMLVLQHQQVTEGLILSSRWMLLL